MAIICCCLVLVILSVIHTCQGKSDFNLVNNTLVVKGGTINSSTDGLTKIINLKFIFIYICWYLPFL